jgi:glycosyltransferase involved in cell wall biosynthesis
LAALNVPRLAGGLHHPQRVLHVSKPTTAGVPTVLLGYVRDQVERGWVVTVACPPDGWLGDAVAKCGADVVEWAATRGPGPSTPAEARRLGRLVASVAPDLVHLHSSKAGLAGRLAIRGRLPTIFQPHAWSFLAVESAVRMATIRWERFATRWTDALVLVSEAERQDGIDHGVTGAAWVVPNGVDVTELVPADRADRARSRARLGLPAEPIAVCVGRLCEQKGQADLLDAWPQVRARLPRAHLAFVGDGPDRRSLEARARDLGSCVRFAGESEEVAAWLAAADVVVVPSRWEAMALVPLEAMARARSVVASDVAGITECLPEDAGAVVRSGDVVGLGREIAARLADSNVADTEGRAGRRHVETHHDRSVAAIAVASVYSTVLTRRARTR